MEYTTNLNLKKPDVNEYYNIEQENENKDLIDSAIGELNKNLKTENITIYPASDKIIINRNNSKITGKRINLNLIISSTEQIYHNDPLVLFNGYISDGIYDLPIVYDRTNIAQAYVGNNTSSIQYSTKQSVVIPANANILITGTIYIK